MTTPEAETLAALRRVESRKARGSGPLHATAEEVANEVGKAPATVARHLRWMADRGQVRRVHRGDLVGAPGRGPILGYRVSR